MDVKDAGRRGGEATKAKRGREFYAEIGRKGGRSAAKSRGPEFYAACAARRKVNRQVDHCAEPSVQTQQAKQP